MKLLDMYNAFYGVYVLYNAQPFNFCVFYLDLDVITHLTHSREYAYPESAYPVGLNLF